MAELIRKPKVRENPRRTASGKWQARIRDSNGRSRYQTFKSKALAEQWIDANRGTKATGGLVNPAGERTRLRVVAEDWFAAHKLAVRGATSSTYRSHLDNWILPRLGDEPIGQLTRASIQRWVSDISSDLAPSTVEAVYRTLATILQHAVDERLVPTSEARKISLPRQERNAHSLVPITAEQVVLLASHAGGFAGLFMFAAFTGLRQGECLGLTCDRVKGDMIRIDRQMVTPQSGPPAFGPPKTAASIRSVPMGQSCWALVRSRVCDRKPSDLLFANPDGSPFRRQRVAEAFKAATKAAGLPGITFHDLRHFYASTLIASGASVKVVQSMLGHSKPTETLDTYGHLFAEDTDLVRDAIDRAFIQISNPAFGSVVTKR